MRIVHLAEVTHEKPKAMKKADRKLLGAKNWMIRQLAKDERKAEAEFQRKMKEAGLL